MDVIDNLSKADLRQETVLTIGAFDGVHRGHQALIGSVVERARDTNRLAALITFHPHPAVVLAPGRAPRYLTTPGEKVAILESLGIDLVVLLPFNRQMAATTAREFMENITRHLKLRELWVGADFALGRNREGDTARLAELGRDLGYELHVVQPILLGDETVSSSVIRSLLNDGDVEHATRLLGRPPTVSGEVVVGVQRGRTLGFPTANLEVRAERAVPADGVYAVYAVLGRERYPAVANVGVRPSFDNGQRTVETHIFDFDKDIYGCDLVVEFVARLRDERRFSNIDDLVDQIGRDSAQGRQILRERPEPGYKHGAGQLCVFRYAELEHTADRALRVWGAGLPDLFAGAARGMFSLMTDLDELVAIDWRQITLSAPDLETLLVDWLNELLFLTETEDLLFVGFECDLLRDGVELAGDVAGPTAGVELVARAGGAVASATNAHIKAATFNDLAVVPEGTGWSTEIVFDV